MQEDVRGLTAFSVLTQRKHDGSTLSSPKCRTKNNGKANALLACTQQGNAVILEPFAWLELSYIRL